jgi:lipopolysaccharide biosynthesis protein
MLLCSHRHFLQLSQWGLEDRACDTLQVCTNNARRFLSARIRALNKRPSYVAAFARLKRRGRVFTCASSSLHRKAPFAANTIGSVIWRTERLCYEIQLAVDSVSTSLVDAKGSGRDMYPRCLSEPTS